MQDIHKYLLHCPVIYNKTIKIKIEVNNEVSFAEFIVVVVIVEGLVVGALVVVDSGR